MALRGRCGSWRGTSGVRWVVALLVNLLAVVFVPLSVSAEPAGLSIAWDKNYLTIRGHFPGGELRTLYLEAYCSSRSWRWPGNRIKRSFKA
jgi:hypothetical protein